MAVRNARRVYRRKTHKKMLRPRNLFRTRRWRTKALYRDPFPKVMYTTLRFAQSFTLTSNDTDAIQTFRLNSVYDVDYTGAGGQPRLTDTLLGADVTNAPYGSYRVLSTKYKVKLLNANSSGNSMGPVGVHVRNSTSTAISTVSWQQLGEVPNTKGAWIGSSGSPACYKTFSGNIAMRDFFALKNTKDSANLAATYNNNPSDQVMLDVMYRTIQSGGSSFNLQGVFIAYMRVQLFDRNLTAGS